MKTQIQLFLDYLKYQKRYSAHTILSYGHDLLQFNEYLEEIYGLVEINNISSGYIRSWLASLKDEEGLGRSINGKISGRSISRKISSLRSFFKFLIRNNVISASPVTQVSIPKSGKRLPVFVKENDTETLFRHIEFSDDWKGKTEKVVLELLYNTGIRLSELINLKVDQLDVSNRSIKVLGKGNKERIIPLKIDLINELQSYIGKKNTEHIQADQDYLFVNEKGKKLYPGYVYKLVKKYLSLVSTVEKKSPHIMRHTFATQLLNNGADLNSVKELLGHASLAATQVYTHNTIEKLKDIHKKAHPANKR